MPLPTSTATVLAYLFRNATPAPDPGRDWVVEHDPGKPGGRPAQTKIAAWNRAEPQPTEAEINAAAASPEFAAWLDERTDPAKNTKRQARAWLQSNEPVAVAMRAVIAEIVASLKEVRTAQGKPNRSDEQFLADVLAKL